MFILGIICLIVLFQGAIIHATIWDRLSDFAQGFIYGITALAMIGTMFLIASIP